MGLIRNYLESVGKKEKPGLAEDLFHLVGNTAIVYFGSALLISDKESLSERLTDRNVLLWTGIAAGLFNGYKIARRADYYFRERRKKMAEKTLKKKFRESWDEDCSQ